MKKFLVLLLGMAVFSGCSSDTLPIHPGVYNLESVRNQTEYLPPEKNVFNQFINNLLFHNDNVETEYPNGVAHEIGEKPRAESRINLNSQSDLAFEPGVSFPTNLFNLPQYASITLGNGNQEFKLAFSPVSGFVDTFYFDQNQNNIIEQNEVFKATAVELEKNYTEKGGASSRELAYSEYFSQVDDLPVRVTYLRSDGTSLVKQLYLSFYFRRTQAPFSLYDMTTQVTYEVKNYFSGSYSYTQNHKKVTLKLLLMDTNNNGVFNDFKVDSVFVYSNQLQTDKEYPLQEYYQSGSSTLKVFLYAFPQRLIITDSTNSLPNPAELEPPEDESGK